MVSKAKPKGLVVTKDPKEPRVAIIRTSDVITFKGCRRRWNWSSHLRDNLGTLVHADPLWMGSGMHFALEDFHGFNLYGSPAMAMQAFAFAFKKKYPKKTPDDWQTLCQLCCDMMDYYVNYWLTNRPKLETYVFEEVPQVEVNIKIPIPMDKLKGWREIAKHYDEVYYSMQLDRVIQDDHGQLWIMEYKSAKNMMTQHFATDPQCSRYVWGADCVYDEPVAGVIYQQHRKQIPKPARVLQNGTISTAQQATSYYVYRQALIDKYQSVEGSPEANVKFLNELAKQETEDMDDFIRRDRVYRNAKSSENEAQKILLEISDMLDPDLSIYPNPTRDCPNFCPFFSPCVSMDDGSDYKYQLEHEFEPRPKEYDEWRTELPEPEEFTGVRMTSPSNINQGEV